MSEEEKKIEIVSGNVTDLEISPVYEHLNAAKPKTSKENKKKIVIPEVKKKVEKREKEDKKLEEEE